MIRRVATFSLVFLSPLWAISARGDAPATIPPVPPATPAASPSNAASPTPGAEADLAARVADLEKQVAELKREKKELVDIVNNHSTMLRDVVSDRQSTGGGKYYVPNVQAIRDDRDSRRELVDTVVHDMTRTTGELRIRNDMATGQSLVINGVDTVYVAPHATRTVPVAAGTATTELAGEGLKSWMIGAPNYYQDIVIAPAVRASVASSSAWNFDSATGVWWRTLP